MHGLKQDFRFALRQMGKSPGFTATTVLTLALGLGAVTTVATWMKAALYDPWPHVRDPRSISFVDATVRHSEGYSIPYEPYRFLRQQKNVIRDSTAFNFTNVNLAPDRLHTLATPVGLVANNYFQFLGLAPEAGRFFDPSLDDRAYGSENAIVLSDALWRTQFHAAPGSIGRTVLINRQPFTVIGVAPPGFQGVFGGIAESAWLPLSSLRDLSAASADPLASQGLMVAVRPAAGVTQSQLEAAVHTLARTFAAQQGPGKYIGWDLNLRDAAHFSRGLSSIVGFVLPMVGGASALLLLLVCVNVAALLGQRAVRRRREVAIRLAIGATRWQVARQVLVEALVVAALGGAAGVIVSMAFAQSLYLLLPSFGFTLAFNIDPDWRIFLFAAAAVLPVAMASGMLPAAQAVRVSQNDALHQAGPSVMGRRSRRGLMAMLGVQLGICFTVLVCSSLLARTVFNVLNRNLGFDKHNALAAQLDLSRARYTPERAFVLEKALLAELAASPDLESATVCSHVPTGDSGSGNGKGIRVPGYTPAKGEEMSVVTDLVGPGFFHTLRIALRDGREFTSADDSNAPAVAMVNETMAKRYWPHGNALGATVIVDGKPHRIVGIVGPFVYHDPASTDPLPLMFVPSLANYAPYMNVVVRAHGPLGPAAEELRAAVAKLDSGLALEQVQSMSAVVSQMQQFTRIPAELLAVYALASLLVATLGIYAALAYATTERRREFALRIALGAHKDQIRRLVLRGGLETAALGLVLGSAGAYFGVRVIQTMLFDVPPYDPASIAAAAGVVLATALLAGLGPARRAASVEPMQALREE